MPIFQQMRDPSFPEFLFDDRVMQLLVETRYVEKIFPKSQEGSYATFLATLLIGHQASISLKAAICRQATAGWIGRLYGVP